jgi:hypothetical protein
MERARICTLAAVVAAFLVAAVGATAANHAGQPTAPAVAADFHVATTHVALPGRCKPTAARERIIAFLIGFDSGRGDRASLNFVSHNLFVPYDGTSLAPRPEIGDGAGIARFVRRRYAAGDGWTALSLLPPAGRAGLPRTAVFTLRLAVLIRGQVNKPQSVKVVIDCRSGLLAMWVGPRVPASAAQR